MADGDSLFSSAGRQQITWLLTYTVVMPDPRVSIENTGSRQRSDKGDFQVANEADQQIDPQPEFFPGRLHFRIYAVQFFGRWAPLFLVKMLNQFLKLFRHAIPDFERSDSIRNLLSGFSLFICVASNPF